MAARDINAVQAALQQLEQAGLSAEEDSSMRLAASMVQNGVVRMHMKELHATLRSGGVVDVADAAASLSSLTSSFRMPAATADSSDAALTVTGGALSEESEESIEEAVGDLARVRAAAFAMKELDAALLQPEELTLMTAISRCLQLGVAVAGLAHAQSVLEELRSRRTTCLDELSGATAAVSSHATLAGEQELNAALSAALALPYSLVESLPQIAAARDVLQSVEQTRLRAAADLAAAVREESAAKLSDLLHGLPAVAAELPGVEAARTRLRQLRMQAAAVTLQSAARRCLQAWKYRRCVHAVDELFECLQDSSIARLRNALADVDGLPHSVDHLPVVQAARARLAAADDAADHDDEDDDEDDDGERVEELAADAAAAGGTPAGKRGRKLSVHASSEGVPRYSGYVVGIDIRTGGGEHPLGWRRIAKDLNAGTGGVPTFLYFNKVRHSDELQPVTALAVVIADPLLGEPIVPRGFEMVDSNLNEGNDGPPIYLCFHRGPGAPITDIGVLSGFKARARPPAGYVKMEQNCNEGAGRRFVHLCYHRSPWLSASAARRRQLLQAIEVAMHRQSLDELELALEPVGELGSGASTHPVVARGHDMLRRLREQQQQAVAELLAALAADDLLALQPALAACIATGLAAGEHAGTRHATERMARWRAELAAASAAVEAALTDGDVDAVASAVGELEAMTGAEDEAADVLRRARQLLIRSDSSAASGMDAARAVAALADAHCSASAVLRRAVAGELTGFDDISASYEQLDVLLRSARSLGSSGGQVDASAQLLATLDVLLHEQECKDHITGIELLVQQGSEPPRPSDGYQLLDGNVNDGNSGPCLRLAVSRDPGQPAINRLCVVVEGEFRVWEGQPPAAEAGCSDDDDSGSDAGSDTDSDAHSDAHSDSGHQAVVRRSLPDGFYRVPLNLNTGARGPAAYLCFARQSSGHSQPAPLTKLKLVTSFVRQPRVASGMELLPADLSLGCGLRFVYLALRRARPTAAASGAAAVAAAEAASTPAGVALPAPRRPLSARRSTSLKRKKFWDDDSDDHGGEADGKTAADAGSHDAGEPRSRLAAAGELHDALQDLAAARTAAKLRSTLERIEALPYRGARRLPEVQAARRRLQAVLAEELAAEALRESVAADPLAASWRKAAADDERVAELLAAVTAAADGDAADALWLALVAAKDELEDGGASAAVVQRGEERLLALLRDARLCPAAASRFCNWLLPSWLPLGALAADGVDLLMALPSGVLLCGAARACLGGEALLDDRCVFRTRPVGKRAACANVRAAVAAAVALGWRGQQPVAEDVVAGRSLLLTLQLLTWLLRTAALSHFAAVSSPSLAALASAAAGSKTPSAALWMDDADVAQAWLRRESGSEEASLPALASRPCLLYANLLGCAVEGEDEHAAATVLAALAEQMPADCAACLQTEADLRRASPAAHAMMLAQLYAARAATAAGEERKEDDRAATGRGESSSLHAVQRVRAWWAWLAAQPDADLPAALCEQDGGTVATAGSGMLSELSSGLPVLRLLAALSGRDVADGANLARRGEQVRRGEAVRLWTAAFRLLTPLGCRLSPAAAAASLADGALEVVVDVLPVVQLACTRAALARQLRVPAAALSGDSLLALANRAARGSGLRARSWHEPPLQDGHFLLHVLAACSPACVPWATVADGSSDAQRRSNAQLVVGALRALGASVCISWRDVVHVSAPALKAAISVAMLAADEELLARWKRDAFTPALV
eukprot:PLAT15531.1.p1 GENE.PLAT15531.1~~PLAT15531.1.p1  ORF type:complete len:1935 (-),score=960.01 PLAT15531.1:53-5263(-)